MGLLKLDTVSFGGTGALAKTSHHNLATFCGGKRGSDNKVALVLPILYQSLVTIDNKVC